MSTLDFCSLHARLARGGRSRVTFLVLSAAVCLLCPKAGAESPESPTAATTVAVQLKDPGRGRPATNAVIGMPNVARKHAVPGGEAAVAATAASQSASPQFSLAAGSYPNVQIVTITDATPGAAIYYTTNGRYPGFNATLYTGAITVSTSETIVAMATASGLDDSDVVAATYIINSSPSSFIYTVAGNNNWGYGGDGGPATAADLNAPTATALDSSGNVYIADVGNNVVRKIASGTGIITTIAGTGIEGHTGDGGPATSAQIWEPIAIAIDHADNLYIAETGDSVVRKVVLSTGVITTYAGGSSAGLGDNGPATQASLTGLFTLTCDTAGNVYLGTSPRVRKVTASTGIITTVAGNGTFGYSGDNGLAINATIRDADGLAVNSAGDVYIADTGNQVIRKVDNSTGIITTVAGGGSRGGGVVYGGDGGPATSAQLNFPTSVALDGAGDLYIADTSNSAIRKVTASDGIINTVAGNGIACYSYSGDGYPATSAALCDPEGLSITSAGDLYFADRGVGRVRKVTHSGPPPTVATAAPEFSLSPGTYPTPQTVSVTDATPGAAIYISTNAYLPTTGSQGYRGPIELTGSLTISAIAAVPGHLPSSLVTASYTITSPPKSIISTVAGNGTGGFSGAGGPATNAQLGGPAFGGPLGLAIDGSGNLYFSDSANQVVWMVSAATGKISIVAGNGTSGFSGDGGPAVNAQLYGPSGIALDRSGNLYIADFYNYVVRKVTATTGIITTVVGNHTAGNSGDGGLATAAQLGNTAALAFDSSGNLYVGDLTARVRRVSASTGIITTVVGGGSYSNFGDGGPATSAFIAQPYGLAFDTAGNLYMLDRSYGRIRKIDGNTGIIETVAGNGNEGTSGDGGLALEAEIAPEGIAVDSAGNIYLSSWPNSVRKVDASSGIITTVAGNGYAGYNGDGGSATVASLCEPQGIAFDSAKSMYIADTCNYRVRKVTFSGPAATPVISLATGSFTSVQTVTITDSTANATIYYTTDGSTPTTASNVYNGAITVAETETLQAIAVAAGYTESAVASATYTINIPISAPSVKVTTSSATISTAQTLSVSVTVSSGAGNPIPTGTVTLTSGNYSSAATALSGGGVSINIAAGALSTGSDTLTANYSPDSSSSSRYSPASGAASVSVVVAAYSMSATSLTVSRGTPGSSTVTVSSTNGYAGTISLTCAITSSPAGATEIPTCTANQAVALDSNTKSRTATVTVNSRAASSALVRSTLRPGEKTWRTGGEAVLAVLLFFSLPKRRRMYRILFALAIAAVLAGPVACGGGSSGSSHSTDPGTTPGKYTITVSGTGNDTAKTSATTTFTLTVN